MVESSKVNDIRTNCGKEKNTWQNVKKNITISDNILKSTNRNEFKNILVNSLVTDELKVSKTLQTNLLQANQIMTRVLIYNQDNTCTKINVNTDKKIGQVLVINDIPLGIVVGDNEVVISGMIDLKTINLSLESEMEYYYDPDKDTLTTEYTLWKVGYATGDKKFILF